MIEMVGYCDGKGIVGMWDGRGVRWEGWDVVRRFSGRAFFDL